MNLHWIKTDAEKPKALEKVLAYGLNALGKGRIVMAQYIPPKTVLSEDFLSDEFGCECDEYDEENDCYWVTEGWWESSEEADTNWQISLKITHFARVHPPTPGGDAS